MTEIFSLSVPDFMFDFGMTITTCTNVTWLPMHIYYVHIANWAL